MMSQAASVDRPRREPSLDRPPRDASKRKSDHEEVAADAKAADRRQKGSVFSRISFPDSGASDGNKKRKLSEAPNGLKSHHETTHRPSSNGYREDWKPVKGGSSGGGRRGSLHDHDSSDEDYHFKRKRPPSVSRHEAAEWEEDARPSRGSRERERSAREHEREWEYERERPSKQHRRPKLESDFVD